MTRAGRKCPKQCGDTLVTTKDAIGRSRDRCPRCDGVAPPAVLRPGEIRRPQGVSPELFVGHRPVHIGAIGNVPGGMVTTGYALKPCQQCGLLFQPTGPNSRYCKRAECT